MTTAEELAEGLADIREEFAVAVTYLVGSTEYELENVSKGHWVFRFLNKYGVTERIQTTDFLVGVEDIDVTPVAGHRIRETIGEKVFEYEVSNINNEPCWRLSENIGHSQRRIHTKLVNTTDA